MHMMNVTRKLILFTNKIYLPRTCALSMSQLSLTPTYHQGQRRDFYMGHCTKSDKGVKPTLHSSQTYQ
ncbi:hypothetical protein CY34DRAFT_182344 [Suillus luteus UH-Slu-Lm8-n1]|uniref:Uncharacterized protein n=1 Tax=Suillus luteus UH-Slu-Lm8-n1 TaxID=930992 RepID=A0A0D0B5V2_9AGAM|nr:hypothetical protein CY34DRAFT_182344 [Suillus luteus UH-Slu-Lm8-n1]